MPKLDVSGLDELMKKLQDLPDKLDPLIGKACEEGSKILLPVVKAEVKPHWVTGDLDKSFIVTRPKKHTKTGITTSWVTPDGYDSKGIPNKLKANVINNGTSVKKKHKFMKNAIKKTETKIISRMEEIIGGAFND